MLSPEFRRHRFQLDRFLQHRIVAVPLHEVGASHECAVFAGASVVVPEIEVDKVDGLGEGRAGEHPVLA